MRLFCLSILVVFCIQLDSQTWCLPGATWHYRVLSNNLGYISDGSIEVKLTGTLTVQGRKCNNLEAKFHGARYFQTSAPNPTVTPYENYSTYADSGIIYMFNQALNNFDTIVNFNAKPGDRWYQAGRNQSSLWTDWLQVYDTGRVNINGVSLKKIEMKDKWGTGPSVIFIERIGNILGYLFVRQICYYDVNREGIFSCYSDDSFPVYKRQGVTECNYTTVSLEEQTISSEFNLFPNPASDFVSLHLREASMVSIIDIAGVKLFEVLVDKPGTQSLSIEDLPQGVYSVRTQGCQSTAVLRLIKL